MVLITSIISLACLWLPSNHYFLVFLILISFLYWSFNKEKLRIQIQNIRHIIKRFTGINLIITTIIVLFIASFAIWGRYSIDTIQHHAMFIRWFEEYPATPGIANIEERMGFNSGFLLLCAPFTMRYILGDPIYTIHLMFVILIVAWSIFEVIISKYEIKRIILLIFSIVFVCVNNYPVSPYFTSLSTDALPNLIVYYLFIKAFLYPQRQSSKYLLYASSTVLLITFKLSTFFFGIIVLFMSYDKIKAKQYKEFIFVISLGLWIITLWCIRNIILSGYLVYPLYQIDLFTYDWKIPTDVLVSEDKYISSGSLSAFNRVFRLMKVGLTNSQFTIAYFEQILQGFIMILSTLSCIAVTVYTTISKKARISIDFFALKSFYSTLLILAVFVLKAPYPRFAIGAMLVTIFAFLIFIFPKNKNYCLSIFLKNSVLIVMTLFLLGTVCVKMKPNIYSVKTNLSKIPFLPLTFDEKTGFKKSRTNFTPYKLNENVTIYISSYIFTFDEIPAVTQLKSGETESRFQDYNCLEARGNSIADGFRYKKNQE